MRALVVILLISTIVGCGGEDSGTVPASGTVTLDGAPVEGAMVTLVPDDTQSGKPAAGQSDSSGNFILTTFSGGDGALPGSYKVQVSKFETPDGGRSPYAAAEPAPEVDSSLSEEEQERARLAQGYSEAEAGPQGPTKAEKAKNLLPAKYASVATSGLSVTVTEGDNVIPLELTSK